MTSNTSGSANAVATSDLNKPGSAKAVAVAVAGSGAAVVATPKPTELEAFLPVMADFFKKYDDAMGPGKAVTAEAGCYQQQNLWKIIKQTLKFTGTDFAPAYEALLENIASRRGTCFNEKNAFRFFGKLVLSSKDRIAFERLLALMLVTAEKPTRLQVIGRYDTGYVYRSFDGSDVPEKLTEFYAV